MTRGGEGKGRRLDEIFTQARGVKSGMGTDGKRGVAVVTSSVGTMLRVSLSETQKHTLILY